MKGDRYRNYFYTPILEGSKRYGREIIKKETHPNKKKKKTFGVGGGEEILTDV